MSKTKLNEIVLPTDRWSARIVSPVEINYGIDTDRYGEVVVLHPGWGKDPERHTELLLDLAGAGFLPLGVDTRYAYSDQQSPRRNLLSQAKKVGKSNPYFSVDTSANRWSHRRPTVLLDICERLGVGERSYIGHSEGGRVATLAAAANPEQVKKLIVVNGAGTGDSSRGTSRLMHSNANSAKRFAAGGEDLVLTGRSALGSIVYALTHLRRTLAEKKVIQSADIWPLLGTLASQEVAVTVLHARGDELIQFEGSHDKSQHHSDVTFIATDGTHSNVYEQPVRATIVNELKG